MAADPIDERDLVYHRHRLRNRVFDCVLMALAERVRAGQVNQLRIAKRMGKDPGQVSKLLAYPTNLKLDTLSDLLRALDADLTLGWFLVENAPGSNYEHPWSKRNDGIDQVIDLAKMQSAQTVTSSPRDSIKVNFHRTDTSENG